MVFDSRQSAFYVNVRKETIITLRCFRRVTLKTVSQCLLGASDENQLKKCQELNKR